MEDETRETSRERMVRSAAILIRERGIHGVGMRQIVEHADAPRGSLQRYFPGGKNQLMIEGINLAIREFPSGMAAAAAAPTLEEAVGLLLAPWHAQLVDHDFRWGCPAAPSVIDAAGNDVLREHAAKLFRNWQAAFTQVFAAHGLSDEVAGDLAQTVIFGIEGAVMVSRAQRDIAPFESFVRNAQRWARAIAEAPR